MTAQLIEVWSLADVTEADIEATGLGALMAPPSDGTRSLICISRSVVICGNYDRGTRTLAERREPAVGQVRLLCERALDVAD